MANPETIWRNWEEVTEYLQPQLQTGRRLFRSSSPNYAGSDSTQNLNQAAVDILVQRGIHRVISFNKIPYTQEELARLKQAGITYRHFPVKDFTAATIEQLREAAEFYAMGPPTSVLMHCGFGHGRTGTGVTAIQLFTTSGQNPPEDEWKSKNHVERDEQVAVLKQFRASVQSNSS